MVENAHCSIFWSCQQQDETTKAGQLVPPAGNHIGDNHFAPGWVTWQYACPSLQPDSPLHTDNM